MGWDFQEFFDSAGEKAQEALNDLVKVGVPAVQVAAQQWAQDALGDMQKESQKELNAAIKEVQSKPSSPGSIGDAFKTTIQGTILETYGMHILIGVVALVVIGMMLKGK